MDPKRSHSCSWVKTGLQEGILEDHDGAGCWEVSTEKLQESRVCPCAWLLNWPRGRRKDLQYEQLLVARVSLKGTPDFPLSASPDFDPATVSFTACRPSNIHTHNSLGISLRCHWEFLPSGRGMIAGFANVPHSIR
jgi:hypothetical protein